ncbi:MAG: tetratricopeptide repeat protein [Alphaproteobacteria bacterium]|nr:tetratricopeptide repeat protein [Alphaproteobacteria bacterium]
MKKFLIMLFCAGAIAAAVFYAYKKDGGETRLLRPVVDYWQNKIKTSALLRNFLPAAEEAADTNSDYAIYPDEMQSGYGAYLAGRVAHLRQDFDTAADYYRIALDKDKENVSLNHTVYVILTSLGHIDEAVPYAQREIETQHRELLAPMVVAIKEFTDGNYAAAREEVSTIEGRVHKEFINPLISAWTYAGEKNEEEAIKSIDSIMNDPTLDVTKLYHKGMIYDYIGNKTKAEECFAKILKEHPTEVTYRILEIVTDFYVRLGDKEKAKQISNHYNDNGLLSVLLKDIDSRIDSTNTTSTPIIDTPQKGLAEALFNIGSIFRTAQNGAEIAQFYIATSAYLNPEYEVSKIALANVLEEVGLLKEANKYYSQINKNSGSYFIARLKMIENYNSLEDYDAAEEQLKILLQSYPNNTQLLSDLAGINSNKRNDAEAVRLYQQAIDSMKQINKDSWPVFYAMAVSYDRLNQKEKAEENLEKAIGLSGRDSNVLNYLGYSWLLSNKNPEKAVSMILEAYMQDPYEGHIIDSVGWVYFRLGQYDKAIEFLEQASALNPGNAVISDHLGDAYWFGGRKNEAVFLWKHALVLKEDSDAVDKEKIKDKIENGAIQNEILQINDEKLLKALEALSVKEVK